MLTVKTALLVATLFVGAPATADAPLVLDDIAWRTTADDGRAPTLTVARGHRTSASVPLAAAPHLADALHRDETGEVRFVITREAGTASCRGTLRADDGRGSCRFVGDAAFERGLAERGLSPRNREALLGMMLVDVTLARADGLRDAGLAPKDAGDLTTAAVFGIGGDDVRALRSAGLHIDRFDDMVAARVLGVTPIFVRGLVDAGHTGLTARQAIELRAVGATPAYARALDAALRTGARR